MSLITVKHRKPLYIILAAVGIASLAVSGMAELSWITGAACAVWIFSFLVLTCEYRKKRCVIANAVFFCAGYLLRFFGALEHLWLFLVLYTLLGILMFCVFMLYSAVLAKVNSIFLTVAFPVLWLVLYAIETVLRVPSMCRIDVLFAAVPLLIQCESVIGSAALSCLILLILSLVHFAVKYKSRGAVITAAAVCAALFITGGICLNRVQPYTDFVSAAYATGPYCGSYEDCFMPPFETNAESMKRSVREAAEMGAEILVFSEEAFAIEDVREDEFVSLCRSAARENGIHILVALDIWPTDGGLYGNRLVWITPEGEILGTYDKAKLIPFDESDYAPGNGDIPSHVITVGGREVKVAYLICYDSNFPDYVRQIDDDTDILLLPSWDWAEVTELHAEICRTIAIENRVSLLKSTYDGRSVVIGRDGNILASSYSDEYGYGEVCMAEIPVG